MKLTELGKICLEDIKRYPALVEYYDSYEGSVCIPLDNFVSNPHVRNEAFSLLGSKNLIEFDSMWVMARGLIGNEEGELIQGVILKSVDSLW